MATNLTARHLFDPMRRHPHDHIHRHRRNPMPHHAPHHPPDPVRDPIRSALRPLAALALGLAFTACTGADAPPSTERIALGPADGHDLPGVDLERVQPGDTAPDFSLESYDGDIVTLSDYRGTHDVVLVFYRGHW